jgi:peroxidase
VSLGRKDGRISVASETFQLPPPQANISQLTQMFAVKGLDLKDLVVLSGNNIHIQHFSNLAYGQFEQKSY